MWLRNELSSLAEVSLYCTVLYIPKHDAAWKFTAGYIRVLSGPVVIPLHCMSYFNLTDSHTRLSCDALIPFVTCIKNITAVLHLRIFTTYVLQLLLELVAVLTYWDVTNWIRDWLATAFWFTHINHVCQPQQFNLHNTCFVIREEGMLFPILIVLPGCATCLILELQLNYTGWGV